VPLLYRHPTIASTINTNAPAPGERGSNATFLACAGGLVIQGTLCVG
jgi:hypothetical protein